MFHVYFVDLKLARTAFLNVIVIWCPQKTSKKKNLNQRNFHALLRLTIPPPKKYYFYKIQYNLFAGCLLKSTLSTTLRDLRNGDSWLLKNSYPSSANFLSEKQSECKIAEHNWTHCFECHYTHAVWRVHPLYVFRVRLSAPSAKKKKIRPPLRLQCSRSMRFDMKPKIAVAVD